MNKIFIVILILSISSCCFAWQENKEVYFEDLDGDFIQEVVLVSRSSGGTGVYHEETRIFKDEDPELRLIFQAETVYEYNLMGNHTREESEITFTKTNPETKARDIIVKSKKIEYEKEFKPVSNTIDLGEKRFAWNGTKYEEASLKERVER